MSTLSSRSPSTALPAFVVSALMGAPALAQVAPAALAECAAIAGDAERLACFDRLSGRAARPAGAPKTEPAAAAPRQDADATAVATPATAAASASMFDRAWGFDASSERYVVSLYEPNYFLAARYTNNLNTAPFDPLVGSIIEPGTTLDSTEAAFQISFKFRAWTSDDRRWGAWVAYTQQSQWQLYNDSGNASRPFRETNYMPELMVAWKPGVELGGLQWNLLSLSFNHQSNGRSDTLSRSWNRIIAAAGVEQGNFALKGRLWWRIPEASDSDDNPEITRYYGWGDVWAIYKWRDHSFAGMIRGNPSTGKGAGQLSWTTPPLLGPLRGYVKLFSGYGETLIDYNWNQTTIGVGLTLNDWL